MFSGFGYFGGDHAVVAGCCRCVGDRCEVVAECGDGPVGGDVENALRWLDGSGIVGDRTQSVQAGEPG